MEYKVVYSQRKTMSISVADGEVTVKAPLKTDIETIHKAVEKHSRWINKNIELQKKKMSMFKNLTPTDIRDIKRQAKVYLTKKVEHFAKIMNLKYGRITITSAQKRFGSCSSKGNLSFSYRLMLYPEPAREYVVVHELAHLVQMNHSPEFYRIVASVLPDYKYRRRLLR